MRSIDLGTCDSKSHSACARHLQRSSSILSGAWSLAFSSPRTRMTDPKSFGHAPGSALISGKGRVVFRSGSSKNFFGDWRKQHVRSDGDNRQRRRRDCRHPSGARQESSRRRPRGSQGASLESIKASNSSLQTTMRTSRPPSTASKASLR